MHYILLFCNPVYINSNTDHYMHDRKDVDKSTAHVDRPQTTQKSFRDTKLSTNQRGELF